MSSMSNVAELSKFIFSLPTYKNTIIFITVVSAFYGIILSIINTHGPITLESIRTGALFGLVVCGTSALIAGITNHKCVTLFKGINLKAKHSMFLGFVCMLLLIVINITGTLIGKLINVDLTMNSFLLGCNAIFAFDFLVLWGVTQIKLRYSVLISFLQPIITFTLLLITSIKIESILGIFVTFFKLIVSFLISAIVIYLFVKITEAPMQKNFNFSVLKLLSYFIAHMNEKLLLIEELFDSMGEEIETLVGIVSFKRKDGSDKALFLSPYIHPGPLGNIGGGNMPTYLAERFSQFTMVAHGPSTHDFNPVSVSEIDKIEESVKQGLSKIEYSPYGSEFKRYNYKTANIGTQFFNKGMLMLSTFAPSGSDDIDFNVGLSVMIESEKTLKTENNIFVDCHNSFNPEKGKIGPGNPEVFELLETVNIIEKQTLKYPIKIGCNQHDCYGFGKQEGLGESKLKTMIIEVNNQKTAFVLFDANNMEHIFRERILKKAKTWDLIDEIEVMTTDTHSVNTLSNGYNALGISKQEEYINAIKESIENAIVDLEEVDVGCKIEKIKNIKTMGTGNYTELISTISSTVTVVKITFSLIIMPFICILIWIFLT